LLKNGSLKTFFVSLINYIIKIDYEIAMIRNINNDEDLKGIFHMTIKKQIKYI
jgi:hypothetical protein